MRAKKKPTANRKRREPAAAFKAAQQALVENRARKKTALPSPKKLFKLIEQRHRVYPPPEGIDQAIADEIARLGDLSFIGPRQFPYVRLKDIKLMRMLLDAKLNPGLQDCQGHSLMWQAVGNAKCIALLLDRGVDVNLRNEEVYLATALMEAARLGELQTVRLLLERGADPRLKDQFECTALDEARENAGQNGKKGQEVIKLLEDAMKGKA